jgi:hypothetical protein
MVSWSMFEFNGYKCQCFVYWFRRNYRLFTKWYESIPYLNPDNSLLFSYRSSSFTREVSFYWFIIFFLRIIFISGFEHVHHVVSNVHFLVYRQIFQWIQCLMQFILHVSNFYVSQQSFRYVFLLSTNNNNNYYYYKDKDRYEAIVTKLESSNRPTIVLYYGNENVNDRLLTILKLIWK